MYVMSYVTYIRTMAGSMTLENAVKESVADASAKYNLNASDIVIRHGTLQWKSECGGPIGNLVFRVPMTRFENSIVKGVSDVSTLISFATLTLCEENRGLAENIRRGGTYGSPHYYVLVDGTNRVRVYIGLPHTLRYTTIDVEYTNDEDTGEYNWVIPPSENLYASISMLPEDRPLGRPPRSLGHGLLGAERAASDYTAIGLCATQSAGLPTRGVSASIRERSGYTYEPPIDDDDDDDESSNWNRFQMS